MHVIMELGKVAIASHSTYSRSPAMALFAWPSGPMSTTTTHLMALCPGRPGPVSRYQKNIHSLTHCFVAIIQSLPLSQIFPTIDSLPASGLTPQIFDWTVPSEHLGFFVFSFIQYSLFFFDSMRQTKLATCQLLGARKYSVSYRNIFN